MRPLKIIATDFLPFRGKVEIDLSDVHAATVTGKNGSGKSSFFVDAILFAVKGQARKRPEGLINDLSTTMSVDFYFQHREQCYLIQRSIEHTKQQQLKFFQIYDFATKVSKKEDLSERLLSETQQKLDDVLGISYNLLLSTSIAQQEDINRLFDLRPSERQDMIMEMLSLDYWEDKKVAVAKYLKDSDALDEKIEKVETTLAVVEGNVDVVQGEITSLRENLAPMVKLKGTLKEEIDAKQKEAGQAGERQTLQTEADVLGGKLLSTEERIKDLKKLPAKSLPQEQVEKLTEDIKVYQEMVITVAKKKEELTTERDDLRGKEIHVVSLMATQQDVNILTRVPCVGTDFHSKCQLLSQAKNTQTEILKYLAGLSHRFATLEDVHKFLGDRIGKINTSLEQLADADKSAIDRQKDAETEINEAKSMLRDIETGLELQKLADTIRDQRETLNHKINKLPQLDLSGLIRTQNKLEEVTEALSTTEKEIVGKEKERELNSKTVTGLKTELEKLRVEETRIASYQILHQAYSDIPAYLFGETIPHIEAYANEILTKIDPLKRIQLRPFKETKSGTQKKSLDVVGWTGTGLRDIENLSGSERFRQGLAIRVALARVNSEMYNTQIGFFIIDEGFGSLDPENVEAVKDVLREVSKQFDLFLVITHIEELKDTFDEEIHVETQKDGSKISILKH